MAPLSPDPAEPALPHLRSGREVGRALQGVNLPDHLAPLPLTEARVTATDAVRLVTDRDRDQTRQDLSDALADGGFAVSWDTARNGCAARDGQQVLIEIAEIEHPPTLDEFRHTTNRHSRGRAGQLAWHRGTLSDPSDDYLRSGHGVMGLIAAEARERRSTPDRRSAGPEPPEAPNGSAEELEEDTTLTEVNLWLHRDVN